MADSSQNPAAVLGDAARFGDVRRRLLFLIGGLIVYRIGTYIPVPGIDPERVASFFRDNAQTIFGIVNTFSGGALERMSIFTMGVMPYISASIIVQMMAMVVPAWMEYRKEGESGRRKLTEITRYGTLGLALFQSFVTASGLQAQGFVIAPGWQFLFVAVVTMIGYFQLFAEPYVMTQGGPADATLSVALLMYEEGFRWWNMGYGAAIAVALFVVILAGTLLQLRLRGRKLGEERGMAAVGEGRG